MSAAPEATRAGERIAGRYLLGEILGEGGAGVVYAAEDERLGSGVALKLMHRAHVHDPRMVARAEREARSTARLGHPNIVRVLDFGVSDGLPFVVMERLEGETLAERIAREGRMEVGTVLTVTAQLLDALAAAHAAGIVHRDVKPANVFLTPLASGVLVKLLDFGLAALFAESAVPRLTEKGILVGSLAYLAPERLLGADADERADVYSVGVCVYEALSGELPFHGPNPLLLRGSILARAETPLDHVRSDVGPALSGAVGRALAKRPEERFESASAMRHALAALNAGQSAARDPAGPRGAPSREAAPREPAAPSLAAAGGPRRAALGVALVAVAVATLAALLLAFGDGGPAPRPHSSANARARPESPAAPARSNADRPRPEPRVSADEPAAAPPAEPVAAPEPDAESPPEQAAATTRTAGRRSPGRSSAPAARSSAEPSDPPPAPRAEPARAGSIEQLEEPMVPPWAR